MPSPLIDCLQYANWNGEVFAQMREGGVDAVHVTISYHENFRDTVKNIQEWNLHFRNFPDLIFHGRSAADIDTAMQTQRTAIFFGTQSAAPIEEDIGLVDVLHALGIRFMQLSYNNQSLLCSGFCEPNDGGITRFGREVIAQMNRTGIVIDMSHSGERSTLEAIECSERPVVVTHANPDWWCAGARNKSDQVIRAVCDNKGMLGFSLYPNHLRKGSQCTLADFCEMIAECAKRYGVQHLGIGSDLCQGQPDSVVQWMRNGTWKNPDGQDTAAKFPPPLDWFGSNLDFPNIAQGLSQVGFSAQETEAIMGGNWRDFYRRAF